MKISNITYSAPSSNDLEEIARLLPICPGEKLVELGCGRAETTRSLAGRFPDLKIIATEVDQIQHAINLENEDLPNVTFLFGGAEKIDLPDGSVNYAIMLKSLHHVPTDLMQQSLLEVARVLVPGGLAYLSEPVYHGPFNDILRLFHDEKVVRENAFQTIFDSVTQGVFELVEEVFFNTPAKFHGFEEFEQRIIGATHTDFNIDEKLLGDIKAAFETHIDSQGIAEFRAPIRIDLLRATKTAE